jgi:DNA-directed RNA polymerase specialized sigma24 family protein
VSRSAEQANPASPTSEGELTTAQFEALLHHLDADRARAGERYEEIRFRLLRFFQWNSFPAAEDLADETLNRVARKLTEGGGAVHDVAAFAWGVARNVRQEALRRNSKTIPLSDLPNGDALRVASGGGADDEDTSALTRLRYLRACIQAFSDRDRKLLRAYYSPRGRRIEGRQRLARDCGLSLVALRVRANRLRWKLETCIERRLARVAGRSPRRSED